MNYVIDFGGACGAHYFLAKALFGNRVKLKWHVVETSGMASKGRELESGELRFFDDLNVATAEMGRVDLLYSSGTLQYVPEPYKTLKEFVDCGARCIFLTRLALTSGERELACVQESRFSENGPGPLPNGMVDGVARYPMMVLRKDEVERIVLEKYEIRIHFSEDGGTHRLRGHSVDMHGYFAVPTER